MASPYQTVFYTKFIFNSYLKDFLAIRFQYVPTYFPLYELVWAMQIIISNEKMYDPQNPAIILCNPDLEAVLNKKAFHHKSLVHILSQHIVPIWPYVILKNNIPKSFYWKCQHHITVPFQFNSSPIMLITPSPHERFKISSHFRSVLAQVPLFNKNETVFSFTELREFLWHYLTLKMIDIVDFRESEIFIVNNDPLGYIFKVSAFHPDQINFLLINQLTPVRRSLRIYDFKHKP